jgi:hypothetical protein
VKCFSISCKAGALARFSFARSGAAGSDAESGAAVSAFAFCSSRMALSRLPPSSAERHYTAGARRKTQDARARPLPPKHFGIKLMLLSSLLPIHAEKPNPLLDCLTCELL